MFIPQFPFTKSITRTSYTRTRWRRDPDPVDPLAASAACGTSASCGPPSLTWTMSPW